MEDPMSAPQLLHPETSAHAGRPGPETGGGGFQDLDVVQAARIGACVLLSGGVNAKGVALQIHNLSGWRWGPFVSVDCGVSEPILERQLFGVLEETGKWDEHAEPRPQLMQDGTIFLYEVGKLSLRLQARLADALGSGGAGETRRRLRKRIMASSSVALLDRVAAGTFDDRLFYRLNAIHLRAGG
jgi:DNA-binding NtrC family response regulator